MEVRLVVKSGRHAGRAIPISGAKFFIGRAEDCELRPHSDLISRHHCAILVDEAGVAVRDFGSKNGTFVNGQRIQAEQELRNGDRLKVGELEFEVRLATEPAAKAQPKVESASEAAASTAPTPTRAEPPVSGDDLDLVSLFGEPTRGTAADTDTRTVGRKQRAASPLAPTSAAAPVAKEPAPQKSADAAAAKEGKGKPEAPGSSRDAAAAMLKNFFKGF